MSMHSRSSSEAEQYPHRDILAVFISDFQKDFEFDDVKKRVCHHFRPAELEYILQQDNEAQVLHLIWVLSTKTDATIMEFLNDIAYDYKWIVNRVKEGFERPSLEIEMYLEKIKTIQRENQKHADYNVHRTQPFIQLRRHLIELKPKHGCVVLLGDLGSGKKWLALDVCCDYYVMRRMDYKIFWIDCINCTSAEQDYIALKTLMLKLNPLYTDMRSGPIADKIKWLKEHIELLLNSKEFRKCLLVLTNVQNIKVVNAFNLSCKRLILTRSDKVSNSLSTTLNRHMSLDKGLEIAEFYFLLDKYIKTYDWRKESIAYAGDIYHLSNGDPYMLNIIAKHLNRKKSNWQQWKKNLETLQIPDEKCKKDIEQSLQKLTQEHLSLYAVLSIFPHCAKIPVKLLAFLWQRPLQEAEKIIMRFCSHAVLKKELLEDHETEVCYLKYVYSSYIKHCPNIQKMINAVDLHQAVVDYYEVEDNLKKRRDVDLFFGSHHDCYFFRCIGYHLYGANLRHLIAQLYMDFGFLGQQIRHVGLMNTKADLRDYDQEILSDWSGSELKHVISFLDKNEEILMQSEDCTLLQYALLDDTVKNMAMEQIKQFPQRLWFQEAGQFRQRRFIVKLKNNCKLVRILESDICIAVLLNNEMCLVDVSLSANSDPVRLTTASQTNIIDIQPFNDNQHLLTFHEWGQLKVWRIGDEVRRIKDRRLNGSHSFNSAHYKLCSPQVAASTLAPKIVNDYINNRRIAAFYLETQANCLHVALENGRIVMLNWQPQQHEFCFTNLPITTNISNIQSLCATQTHWMILHQHNNATNITFVNQRNTGKEQNDFDWPDNLDNLVYCRDWDDGFLLVFCNAIVFLRLHFTQGRVGGIVKELLDKFPYRITCAQCSSKGNFIVLGTDKGLKVIDLASGSTKLQSNVGEQVKCVDIYDLDDKEYQCMMICGIESKDIVYLYGIRKTRDNECEWQHISNHTKIKKPRNIYLVGQHLMDYTEDGTLYAVDTNNRVHQINTNEENNWQILRFEVPSKTNIKAICSKRDMVFVALDNGQIYDVHACQNVTECPSSPAIEHLQLIGDNILVASSMSSPKGDGFSQITVLGKKSICRDIFVTKFSFLVFNQYLLLITKDGAAAYCDMTLQLIVLFGSCQKLADCDLKDNVLFLAFAQYEVHIHTLSATPNGLGYRSRCKIMPSSPGSIITSVCAAANGKMFALGTCRSSEESGDIEVYKLDDNYKEQLLYVLRSHKKPVYDMHFSPQGDTLVSVSEQLCFWSVSYILNNPLDFQRRKRLSSRFSSQKSTEEVDANMWTRLGGCIPSSHELESLKYLSNGRPLSQISCESDVFEPPAETLKEEENIWQSLRGPEDKPELLSCLKLDGYVAKRIYSNKQFSQFFAIDNEGVYYNFIAIAPPSPMAPLALTKDDSPDSVDTADYIYPEEIANRNQLYGRLARLSIGSNASGADVVDNAGAAT